MTGPTPRLLRTAVVALALTGLATACGSGSRHSGPVATTTGGAPAGFVAAPGAQAPGSTPAPAPTPASASAPAADPAGQLAAVEGDLATIDAANDQSDGDFNAGVAAQGQNDTP